ncbi:hypothetical protein H6F67_26175 [Microcoleus sp. FACHB-1515]|uniref:hypothetical protein n=1 Tax=Cyanophyceae TaxID=3028117 RepID=UPI0016828A65|nr:hypothetical protein [Microcoleus sp. FACHB-1515]MBD2093336.1 hypothetical protein [Microcoleus sp. FACHB-1515]
MNRIESSAPPAVEEAETGAIAVSASPPAKPRLDADLPPPPLWLKRAAKWFRVGFGLFLFVSLLLGSMGCSRSNASTVPWQSATAIGLKHEFLTTIVTENSSFTQQETTAELKHLRVWRVPARGGRLLIFDFNDAGLCGAAGCLYLGYWQQGDQMQAVLNQYFDPALPPDKPLFEERQCDSDRPCLRVWQSEGDRLRSIDWAFDGSHYEIVESRLYELPPDD